MLQWVSSRRELVMGLVEKRLGETDYLAGNAFTAADIVTVFSLTTMRLFLPFSLTPYSNILAYLQRIGAREAYRRAMQKGDPDMTPMLI
jgi:glutathione S-transferase